MTEPSKYNFPKAEKVQIFERVETYIEGEFSTTDAYLQALILQDKARKEHLEPLLVEGLESGEATPMTAADWEAIRSTVRKNQSDQSQHG